MKNILLIGLGRFGKHVAYQLNELGHEVMAVDANEILSMKFFRMLQTHRSVTVPMRISWSRLESKIMIFVL